MVQDDFLAQIAEILKENQRLPKNIIASYLKFHSDDLVSEKENNLKTVLKKIKRMINF